MLTWMESGFENWLVFFMKNKELKTAYDVVPEREREELWGSTKVVA